ncbi:MAG TPA: hypothetical protein VKT73_15095 [Xanthobacteraceae bacterium]|nr:hypothetical protein [Xanthobacteraceae bacterium]
MVAKLIDRFGGMVPAVDDRLIPDAAAALSRNTWLYSGKLMGIPTPKLLHTCVLSNCGRVFRLPKSYTDPKHFADSDWLEFSDVNTDVLRSPVVGDTFDRYYWASSSSSPKYNTRARITAGSPEFLLGIPAPSTPPGVSASGGSSSVTDSRAYVTTWVSAYGEEGQPSPPTNLTGKIDDTWHITLPTPDAGDLGTNRNLTKVRIYRTVTASTGQATFFFVAELPIATASYDDTLSDTVVSEASELESTNWSPPPSDLQGITAMPNGMFVGFRGNELWFCEPYRPHAWPALYTITTEYPIIGLGVTGQTLIACTQGFPTAFSGVNPASVTESKIQSFEPCESRGSILSSVEGVYYASPNGLILCTAYGAINVTRTMLTKDKWQSLATLTTLRSARLGQAYLGFGSPRVGVFQSNAFQSNAVPSQDFGDSRSGVLIDPTDARVAFNVLTSDDPTFNIFNDTWSGEIFIIRNNEVQWLDFADDAQPREPFLWRSKIFQTTQKKSFEALKIYFEVPDGTAPQNPVRDTDPVQTLADDQYGIVRVYADNNLKLTREIRTSGELMRLPSGFKADFWQFEIEARVNIFSFQVATSSKELANV